MKWGVWQWSIWPWHYRPSSAHPSRGSWSGGRSFELGSLCGGVPVYGRCHSEAEELPMRALCPWRWRRACASPSSAHHHR
eukprot:6612018-Pyramimonas_sp.AAC.1